MYIAEIVNQWRKRKRKVAQDEPRLPPTVYALGTTSLLTDISTEMVTSILPVYLLLALRLSPAEYGLLDGLFRGGAAVVALLLGGMLADGSGRSKLIAGLGYLFSATTRLLLLAGSSFSIVASSLILDRLGKGMRVAPRDAMLAASVPGTQLGLAFGVHRAMDAVGAMLGPLLAAWILWCVPNGFSWVFGISLLISVLGLVVFFRFVRDPVPKASYAASGLTWKIRLGGSLPPACRHLLWLAMLLALFTVSEGMMYAHLQRSFALEPYMQPLLPVATASAFLLLASPVGYAADRYGAVRVFCIAHLLLLPIYGLLVLADGQSIYFACAMVILLGCFFAATDGVLMAAVSSFVAPEARGTGLAIFAAGIAIAKLASSFVFGLLWDRFDITWAAVIYAAGLAASLGVFFLYNPLQLLRTGRPVDNNL